MTYSYDYPRPALTVDIVVFSALDEKLQVLLIQRRSPPFQGAWALPGGFIEMDESLDQAARRELEEETGIQVVSMDQLYTYGDPQRDPRGRVISVAYFTLIQGSVGLREGGGSDACQARFYPLSELPALAFDHAEIIADALQRLRDRLKQGAFGSVLMPERFTINQLRRMYEIVLGEGLDARILPRRMLAAGIIEATEEHTQERGSTRQLYRYRPGTIGNPQKSGAS